MNRGFSTLEILLAMTLLVLALSGTVLLASGGSVVHFSALPDGSLLVDAQTDEEALNYAQAMLEGQQALARKDFKLVNPTSSVQVQGGVSYTKNISVTPIDYFTKKIKASISWPAQYGRSQQVSLTSLVSNFENAVGGDTCYSMLTKADGTPSNWASPQTTSKYLGADLLGDSVGTYPITGLDVYQKRLYVTVGGSQNVGPKPGVTAINKGTIGTVAWATPSGALASGGSVANAALPSSASSNYLWVTGFGPNLAIPQGAAILGIQVDVWRSANSANAIVDNQVRLIKSDGSTLSSLDRAKSTTWSTGTVDATYGNTSDLWGETWTPADINSANFGLAFSAKNTAASSKTASVDYLTITVTYAKEFYIFDVSNPTSPTFLGGLGNSTFTGLNAVAVATSSTGSYAYALTNSTTGQSQLEVINVSNPATAAVVSTFPNISGTGMGQGVGTSIFYSNSYVYVGLTKVSGPEFNIIDVHVPGSPVYAGSYPLGATVNSIYVRGRFAFIAHPAGSQLEQLTILDVSDPTNPVRVGGSSNPVGTGATGKSIYNVGDTAYVGRTTSSPGSVDSIAEFYKFGLDSSNPAAVATTSQSTFPLPTSGDGIYQMLVRDYLAFLLTGNAATGNGMLRILDLRTAPTPPTFATVALPNAGAPAGLDCEGNYLYAASVPPAGASVNKGSISIITAP
jgi:hypothetical protein